MPYSEIIRLAFESLKANKLRSVLTMLGLIIGVGAVVLLVSIGNGAKNYIIGEFQGIGTNLIMVQPGKSDRSGFGPPMGSTTGKLTLADEEAIKKQAFNLEAATGVMFGAGTVKLENKSMNVTIFGSNEQLTKIMNLIIAEGSFFSKEDAEFGRRVVVIGHDVAELLFENGVALGKFVKIHDSEHRVVAVIGKMGDKLGLNFDKIVIVPARAAMRFFNENKLFGMRFKAKSKVGVNEAVSEIKMILKARHNNTEDFTIITQDSMLQTMNTILGMLTLMLGGIAAISMIVGGIGIMNIMLVSVTERTREIGIRRAVGAKRKDVLRQFMVEAVVLSIVGGMIGMVGSTGITYLVYFFKPVFDMRAPAWVALPAFTLSCMIGVAFGVWPAMRASKIETIEALRFE